MEAAPLVLSFYEDNMSHYEPWEPKRGNNFYTLSYQKASLTAEYNQMSEGKLLRYWIINKDNMNEIIGSVCFQNILKDPYRSCCIGYKLSHRHLHKGYALESIQSCIEFIFSTLHMHRIEAYIMPSNEASIRLIERLSFTFEGLCRSFACIDGVYVDHYRYALIAPEEQAIID